MNFFRRERLIFIASLLTAIFCLSVYTKYLYCEWEPIVKSQSLSAARLFYPIAQDFPVHWTASYMALRGEAVAVYNDRYFKEIEEELVGVGGHVWPYPPTALFIDLPLALLPYFLALTAWLLVTTGLYLLVLYCIAPSGLTLLWSLAFFASFENFYFGQNGFLSGALLGGGLLLLDGSPLWGGALLGLLSYKPHLAVLIPLALLAGRRWRALLGTAISAAGLALASLWMFGYATWVSFFQSFHRTLKGVNGWVPFYKMPSVFATVRLAGYGASAAWIIQGLTMIAVVIMIVWLWRTPASKAVRVSGLVMGTLLLSPYIFYYDLTLLAIPLAWLWWEGHCNGWLPLEQLLLFCAWLFPLLTYSLEVGLRWPAGPLYLIPLVILTFRRHQWEKTRTSGICITTIASET